MPDGTKPLIEPMLTNRQWILVAFTWGQFHRTLNFFELEKDLFDTQKVQQGS